MQSFQVNRLPSGFLSLSMVFVGKPVSTFLHHALAPGASKAVARSGSRTDLQRGGRRGRLSTLSGAGQNKLLAHSATATGGAARLAEGLLKTRSSGITASVAIINSL